MQDKREWSWTDNYNSDKVEYDAKRVELNLNGNLTLLKARLCL